MFEIVQQLVGRLITLIEITVKRAMKNLIEALIDPWTQLAKVGNRQVHDPLA